MRKLFTPRTALLSFAGFGLAAAAHAIPMGSAVVGGLLQTDYANFSGDKDNVAKSGADIRRAKIWIKGNLNDVWSYQLGYDARETELDTSWVGYNGFDPFWVAAGYIDIPQGLNYWSGYVNNTFMEYATVVAAFQPKRGLGVYIDGMAQGEMLSYQAAVYMPDIRASDDEPYNTRTASYGTASDEWGAAARGVFKPEVDMLDAMHLGASARYEGASDTELLNPIYTTPGVLGPTSGTRNDILVEGVNPTTGGVQSTAVYGAELAAIMGPLSAQGEYQYMHISGRSNASALNYKGWYAQAAYVITGETRAYDPYSATIGSISKINAEYGAWELALRYGYTNLDDNGSTGWTPENKRGTQSDWTVGVNWYIMDNVKFQGNYNWSKADYAKTSTFGDKTLKAFGVRAQVDF